MTSKKKIDFDLLKLDYLPTDEDEDLMYTIKQKIFSLSEPEQRVFLLYCELGSYSAVAKQLHVSSPTVKKYVITIKKKLGYDIC